MWHIATVTVLSGCTTYRDAVFPSGHVQSESEIAGEQVAIEAGSKARVMLVSGEKYTGTVVSVSESELVLAHTDEPGMPERTFARADVTSIAIEHKSYAGPIFVAALVVGVVTVVRSFTSWAEANPLWWIGVAD